MVDKPKPDEVFMYLPAWFRGDSGLLLPSTVGQPAPPGGGVPTELLPPPQPVAVAKSPPTFMDQVAVYADEDAAGLPTSSLEQVREWAAQVPFEPGMAMVAVIAAKAFAMRGDQAAQVAFARELYGEDSVFRHLKVWLRREGKHAHLFAEQHALMLERILLESAKPGLMPNALTPPEPAVVARALLGCTSVAYDAGEEMSREARVPEDLIAIFLQNGAYNSKASPMGEMARVQELFVKLAHSPDLLPSQDKVCPLDEWMVQDHGFTIEEQLRIGFALAAMTQAWFEGQEAGKIVYLAPEIFDDLVVKFDMTERREHLLDLISADRATFQADFADAGASRAHVAWETRPLMRHPFLRCENGGLIMLSPRGN